MTKDKLWINFTFKQWLTSVEFFASCWKSPHRWASLVASDHKWRQQSEVVLFSSNMWKLEVAEIQACRGDNNGWLRKRKKKKGSQDSRKAGHSTQQCLGQAWGAGKGTLLLGQRLHVLTEWREAPSRARISAALTAGIAAAPLTHAGSRDTAAPC